MAAASHTHLLLRMGRIRIVTPVLLLFSRAAPCRPGRAGVDGDRLGIQGTSKPKMARKHLFQTRTRHFEFQQRGCVKRRIPKPGHYGFLRQLVE
jgi:hypothetical protein